MEELMNKNGVYGFVGFGLIGGSLARNLKEIWPDCRILVYSRSRAPLEEALKEGLVDRICDSPSDDHFSACSCIFLCAPVENNIAALSLLKEVLAPGCLLTDVGSVKTGIHREVERLGLEKQFIGGHPMAGSEKSGLASAQTHLFENAYYIMTPTDKVPEEWAASFRKFILALKAIPLQLDYREHDRVTAAISHLPHLIAAALVNTVHDLDDKDEHMKTIAAGGFRDITRIASSSPQMWEQICVDNRENIAETMDVFIGQLQEARMHFCQGDGAYINQMFTESRDYRDSFSFSTKGPIQNHFRIYCDIIDENGAIATIATLLAVHNISIRNISIVHNREFEQGALGIEFYREDAMRLAVDILRHHRYTVWENK